MARDDEYFIPTPVNLLIFNTLLSVMWRLFLICLRYYLPFVRQHTAEQAQIGVSVRSIYFVDVEMLNYGAG